MELTHERLLELLTYEASTGHFIRNVTTSSKSVVGSRAGTRVTGGYRQINFSGKRVLEHRLAWFYANGTWPPCEVDHINGDRSDNRLANLRLATHQQNNWNRTANGASRQGTKWRAYITTNDGRFKHLGRFDTEEEAQQVRARAAMSLRGDFGHQSRK